MQAQNRSYRQLRYKIQNLRNCHSPLTGADTFKVVQRRQKSHGRKDLETMISISTSAGATDTSCPHYYSYIRR